MKKNVIAAIDVGSHALRMKIGEIDKEGVFNELENFRKTVVLGHETFTKGKVDFDSVDKVCEVLKVFKNTMTDYNVTAYKALATSAIREASNKDYIIDQIKLKTGLKIEIIDNSEEQYLTHKAIKNKLENYQKYITEGAVIVVIGAGSIQITTYKDGELRSSQNVKMGALRVREAFGSLEDESLKFNRIIDEYITTNLENVDFFKESEPYQHLIAVGGEISVISNIVEEGIQDFEGFLLREQFENLYNQVFQCSREEIEAKYQIKRERAELILPSMILFKKFLDHTVSDNIVIPKTSLTDGIIWDIYEDLYHLNQEEGITQDIVTNAEVLAQKFQYHEKHAKAVERYALTIFDRTKRLHGMENERILLRISAILHDIGKFISLDQHATHSYEIIKSLEIFGLSQVNMELIANIARYHSTAKPKERDNNFVRMQESERVIVSKLVAIIRIADALDRSHHQKMEIISVKLREKELIIKMVAKANVNTTLEEWTFVKKADFFKEVFGITPILKIKREL